MQVLVTGADGFIGTHLTAQLLDAGWQVDVVARRQAPSGVRRRYQTLEAAGDGLDGLDHILYVAGLAHEAGANAADNAHLAVNAHAPMALLRAAHAAGVRRFVYLSSFKVLGDSSPTPLGVHAPYRGTGPYAESKIAAERLMLDAGPGPCQRVIVRPPLTYGPGVKANFLRLLRWADSPWPIPVGNARAPRAWLGVHNLVALLVHLLEAAGDLDGRILHVADREQVGAGAMFAALRSEFGRRIPALRLPLPLLSWLARGLGRQDTYARLFDGLPMDTSGTEDLGWRPPYSQAEQIRRTVAWYRTRA
ncbi:MAG: NAD-dependent epimerase/dehydratase family protein [Pseudomonadota bacterium]